MRVRPTAARVRRLAWRPDTNGRGRGDIRGLRCPARRAAGKLGGSAAVRPRSEGGALSRATWTRGCDWTGASSMPSGRRRLRLCTTKASVDSRSYRLRPARLVRRFARTLADGRGGVVAVGGHRRSAHAPCRSTSCSELVRTETRTRRRRASDTALHCGQRALLEASAGAHAGSVGASNTRRRSSAKLPPGHASSRRTSPWSGHSMCSLPEATFVSSASTPRT